MISNAGTPMSDVVDLTEFRLKRRLKAAADWAQNVAQCMYCGETFAWGRRFDHNCQDASRDTHPSMQ